ncbi:flagellar hook-associated protein FlgL [Undibacterium sp. Jales W-56]|uniref:flagellar hook-associated protein FlgL n=1 Tax=Undibacterium sp. Jales W-56 TaxID=2897325 RepID=UPI0021D27AA6|nr:flagellar hook-associated protein FlgL [Undibacterium sp. Jales W-56]MCU6433228.1 flagellar hook-associated protein FlgL [Undibacterium sp. Jales W-56]
MRISTSTIYETGGARISDLHSSLNKTQQQIAAGTRILAPSDDPVGSARALVLTQSNAINDQYAINRQNAKNSLSSAETALQSVTTTLQNVKTLIVNAGNGALSDLDRGYIATELQGNLDQLLSQANATDGTGNYLFAGFSNTSAPYVKTAGGATYTGDQGQRFLQVNTSRQLAVSDIGPAIFGNIRTSNGQFNVVANPSNTGKLVATAAINPATAGALTGNNYDVVFDATGANFSVINRTTNTTVVPSTAYTSPQSVTFDGITTTLTNTPTGPGAGDKFSIQPGNQDIFETLTDLINILKVPTSTPNAKLDLTAGLTQANNNLDKSLSNVLSSRANLGTSLKEIDELSSAGDSIGVAYKQAISEITDLDYAKAITELNQQQVTLQAAQQSFVKTSALSLFSYIN